MSIDPALIGDAGPSVEPGDSATDYGSATLEPVGPFEVRSFQTFELTYRVGEFGLDDTGAIRLAFRIVGDQAPLQTHDPTGIGYVTARCTGGGKILLDYQPQGGRRPFSKILTARLQGGFLKPDDEITVVLGDTGQGSPGMLLQTFAETGFTIRVLTDLCATGHFLPLKTSPEFDIIPSQPAKWAAVLPSLRRPGEPFSLGIKVEDRWGNPTFPDRTSVTLEPSLPVNGLPETISLTTDARSNRISGLQAGKPGTLFIKVRGENGVLLATAGPLVIADGDHAEFWGDMHGQSGETVGVGSAEDYFIFARDHAFLDACAHQGNDFQINSTFWRHLNRLVEDFNEDGRFVTVPGYEWSGNTAVGGDRNVYYRTANRPVYRSSHALMIDRSEIDNDACDAKALFSTLAREDAVVAAHVGGRYADIGFAHDPTIERMVEIHSDWGTFEWIAHDAFDRGFRVGIVANSDGHKGRPGASYPGAATFGAFGGLTCFKLSKLSRDDLIDCWRERRHFATTGCRTHLDVRVKAPGLVRFDADPMVNPNATSHPVSSAMMGDIVRCDGGPGRLTVDVSAHAGIDSIEVRNGKQVIATYRPFGEADLGKRYRVLCAGAEYRGRGRQTLWRARMRVHDATLSNLQPINRFNPERPMQLVGRDTVVWQAATTGNMAGFDIDLDADVNANMALTCNHGAFDVALGEIGVAPLITSFGGLERRIEISRKPDQNHYKEVSAAFDIALHADKDDPIWVCVTLDDGHQIWSSPIYVID